MRFSTFFLWPQLLMLGACQSQPLNVRCGGVKAGENLGQVQQCFSDDLRRRGCQEPLSASQRSLWATVLFGYEAQPSDRAGDAVTAIRCTDRFKKLVGATVTLSGFEGRVATTAVRPDRTTVWLRILVPASPETWFDYNKYADSVDISNASIVGRQGRLVTVRGVFRPRGDVSRPLLSNEPSFMITKDH